MIKDKAQKLIEERYKNDLDFGKLNWNFQNQNFRIVMLLLFKQIKQIMKELRDNLKFKLRDNFKIFQKNYEETKRENAIIEISNLIDGFNNRLDTKEKKIMN